MTTVWEKDISVLSGNYNEYRVNVKIYTRKHPSNFQIVTIITFTISGQFLQTFLNVQYHSMTTTIYRSANLIVKVKRIF